MARIRSIHPEACESDKLVNLSDGAERTYWRLLTHSDDAGRGRDNPQLLAAKLYPLDDDKTADTLDAHLSELVEAKLLVRYEVDGKRYYEIHDFTDWQKPRHPTPTKLPSPDDPSATSTAERGNATAKRGKAHAVVGEGDGGGGGEEPSSPREPVDDGFQHFWDAWPKRNGKKLAKDKAHRAWSRLTLPERRDAYRGAVNYAAASNAGMAGAKDAFRWLQGREWPDWQTPAQSAGTQQGWEDLDRHDPSQWSRKGPA